MGPVVQLKLYTHQEARNSTPGEPLARLSGWLTAYPMNGHAELGRTGAVCPFVRQASKHDVLRIAISPAGPADEESTFAEMRSSFAEMEKIPKQKGRERLGAIAVGFPNCDTPEGLAMLERVFQRHKYYTIFHFRMMAYFYADNNIHGLWNPDFRPMRSPMPVLGVRYMVEQDAAFAAKHKIMTAPYLMRFGVNGARRLVAHLQHKAVSESANT